MVLNDSAFAGHSLLRDNSLLGHVIDYSTEVDVFRDLGWYGPLEPQVGRREMPCYRSIFRLRKIMELLCDFRPQAGSRCRFFQAF